MLKEKTHILQKCCPASSRCASQNKTGYYSVNKLRIFHLSPGHLNPRLSARVIGSKIGEVVEVVVDLVDNGQCGLKKKAFCKLDHRDARWSGFFVFVTPFHTYAL